jgi:hypothetical protein
MTPSTATRTWRRAVPVHSNSRRVLVGVLLAVVAVAVVVLAQRMPAPHKAPGITIDNPSDYAVTIEATGADGTGWMSVAIVDPHSTYLAREVIDQGSVWSLRFTSQGVEFSDHQVTRSDLAAEGWHYTIPSEIGDQLAEAGVPRSP